MRYATLAVITAWTVGIAVLLGFTSYVMILSLGPLIIEGQPVFWGNQPMSWTASLVTELVFFGICLGFGGGCLIAGVKLLRAIWRHRGTEPEVLPGPRPRGDILVIRRNGFPFTPFFSLVAFVGWLVVFLYFAELLGWLPAGKQPAAAGEQPLALLIVGGMFAAIGHGALLSTSSIAFDLRQHTWRIVRGALPLRFRKSGSLEEIAKIAVAHEARSGDAEADYWFVVARLVWLDPSRPPLLLTERPNALDGLRSPMGSMSLDYRPAVLHWAAEIADLLGLSLVDETKYHVTVGGDLDLMC
jgi:hypothetical protein